MKLTKIIDFIQEIKQIPELQNEFDYIGYEIPKSFKKGNSLVVSDIAGFSLCSGNDYIQFRIIGKIDGTASKIKFLKELLYIKISGDYKIGFSKILFDDESNIIFNSEDRFEQLITFIVY